MHTGLEPFHISKAKTLKEAIEFWETHDTSEYWDQMPEVKFERPSFKKRKYRKNTSPHPPMEVKITQVRQEISGRVVVGFSCDTGSAMATWQGDNPDVNSFHYVECDVTKSITWGEEITPNDTDHPKIWHENDTFYAYGLFYIYSDGLHWVRIGDTQFNLRSVTNPPSMEQPCRLAVPHRSVELFPINI